MSSLLVRPAARRLEGEISVPPDKSLSHRAILLSALTQGGMELQNILGSETVQATIDGVRALGVDIESKRGTTIVCGRGLNGLREPAGPLFCRGSGTTMRLLAGICAGQDFFSILDGAEALKRRPMSRVIEPLRAMGASIYSRDRDRLAPLAIRGARPLHARDHTLSISSAQVKSAILLAGLFADGTTTVREPALSRDHTERMLSAWGAAVERPTATEVRITAPAAFNPPSRRFSVPNDISSAAFFIVLSLLLPRSSIRLPGVGLNPTRTGLLDVLSAMGARVQRENERNENGEIIGDILVCSADGLAGVEIGDGIVPRMIDEFPILAVAATQAVGETRVRDAAELHHKESDRIDALVTELRKMGAQIDPQPDGFVVEGPTRLRGANVHSHGDHRLAMSLAVAGLLAEGETLIEGWGCVSDSFPGFERLLAGVSE